MTMMSAMLIESFGESDVIKKGEVTKPTVTEGKALVKVTHSAVNPLDVKIREGLVKNVPAFPLVINCEMVGVVQELLDESAPFSVGDTVYGVCGGVGHTQGVLSEYVLAETKLLAKVPDEVDALDMAGLALVGLTAALALEKCTIVKDNQILIHGGVGGVGHLALQMAKKLYQNDVVVTVGSEADSELALSLGASAAINFREESVEDYCQRLTGGKGFPVIFDTVGQGNLENSLKAVAKNGHVITTAARTTLDLSPLHAKSADLHVLFMMLPIIDGPQDDNYQRRLSDLAHLYKNKELTLLSNHSTYGFSEVARAQDDLMARKTQGKVKLVNDL